MYIYNINILKVLKNSLFAALICLLCNPLMAIAAEKSNFVFYTSSVSDALGSNTVILSYEDSLGYMWFVTQEGLHQYDGSSVTTFITNREDEKSLISRTIIGIHETNKDIVWIFTDIGVQIFERRSRLFKNILLTFDPQDSSLIIENITATTKACDNSIIFNVDGKGIYLLEGTNNKARLLLDIAEIHQDAQVVTSMALIGCSDLWISFKGFGLASYNIEENRVTDIFSGSSYPFNKLKEIVDMKVGRSGSIWMSTSISGLMALDVETKTWSNYAHDASDKNSISSNFTRRIYIDKDGLIWISTHNALNLYDEKSKIFIRFGLDDGLPSDDIVSVYQNIAGVYWIGTRDGLVTGYRSMMQTISSANGLSSDGVNALYQSDDGSIWVGTDDGLNKISPSGIIEEIINASHEDFPILDSTIMSLLVEDGIVWAGTARTGLYRLDLNSRTYHRYYWDPANDSSLGANGVSRIVRLNSGELLIGTYGGGLSVFNELDGSFKNYTSSPDDESTISDNHVLDILQQKNGDLWIGTERGLNEFDRLSGDFTRYLPNRSHKHGITDNFSWQLYEDGLENLWVGTRNGIFLLPVMDRGVENEKVFDDLSIKIGLVSNQIYAIGEDLYGNIWMSHNRGLTRYDRATNESQQFDLSDERSRVEFNHAAIFIDSERRLLFGHNKGFSIVDARQLPVREYAPRVAVTSLSVLGRDLSDQYPLHAMEDLTLKPSEENFSLSLSVMDYRNPSGNRLAYKLEGLDRDWIDIGSSRSVTVSGIPAGEYIFRAKAITSDGLVNDDALSFKIIQLPPIWATSFAYALYFFIAISVAGGLLRLSSASRKATALRQLELERLVANRTTDLEFAKREAERASASKSTFMATITHEIRTPMHGVLGMTELLMRSNLSSRQYEFASAAYGSGVQLLELINSILDFSKSEAVTDSPDISRLNIAEIIDEVTVLFYPAAQKKEIDLFSDCRFSRNLIVYSDKKKVLQILKNIVNNAVKFTLNGRVCVRAELLENSQGSIESGNFDEETFYNSVRISVVDSGIGISNENIERIFEPFFQADASDAREFGGTGLGLSICNKYAQIIGGSLSVRSEKGIGTQVDFLFPSLANDIERKNKKHFLIEDDIVFIKPLCVNFYGMPEDRADVFLSAIEMFIPGLRELPIKIIDSEFSNDCVSIISFSLKALNIGIGPSQFLHDFEKFSLNVKVCDDFHSADESSVLIFAPFTLEKIEVNLRDLAIKVFKKTSQLGINVFSDSLYPLPNYSSETNLEISKLRVLIAEDMPVNQKIVSEMLLQMGVSFDVTSNGLEVFNKYSINRDYDIIFMDCQMPVLDGFEATKRIRDFERNQGFDKSFVKRVSIVALTAGESSDELNRCYEVGMDEVIVKPYSFEGLQAILQKYSKYSSRVGFDYRGKIRFKGFVLDGNGEFDKDDLDVAVINQIFDIEDRSGKIIFKILLDEFERAYLDCFSKMEKAIQIKNFKEIKFLAHSLRGIASNLGARSVAASLKEIEYNAGLGNSSDIESHIMKVHEGKKLYNDAVLMLEGSLGRKR